MRILIVTAMEAEFEMVAKSFGKDLIKNMGHVGVTRCNNMHMIIDGNISLICTGVGKVNAATSIASFLSVFKVDKIINVGFAAAGKGIKLGSIVMVHYSKEHDMSVPPEIYQSPIQHLKVKSRDHLVTVTCFTGDKFVNKEDILRISPLQHQRELSLFDMELYAICSAARKFNTEVWALKIVSDLPLNHEESSIKEFSNSVDSFMEQFYLVAAYIKDTILS